VWQKTLYGNTVCKCRKAMMGAVPELEGSFIKVPKILKENQE
jgi:hypothetical protein